MQTAWLINMNNFTTVHTNIIYQIFHFTGSQITRHNTYFSYEIHVFPFKPEQLKGVMAFLEGRDVFVSGHGKFIIYGILCSGFDKLRSNVIACI